MRLDIRHRLSIVDQAMIHISAPICRLTKCPEQSGPASSYAVVYSNVRALGSGDERLLNTRRINTFVGACCPFCPSMNALGSSIVVVSPGKYLLCALGCRRVGICHRAYSLAVDSITKHLQLSSTCCFVDCAGVVVTPGANEASTSQPRWVCIANPSGCSLLVNTSSPAVLW